MNMVGHQTKRIHFALKGFFELGQVIEVVKVVILTGKNCLAIVPTLNDMVRIIGQDYAGFSWHAGRVARFRLNGNK
jgi:hypothetical protein